MTLAVVSSSTLLTVQAALASARLVCPVTRDALMRVGIRSQRGEIEKALAALEVAGCTAVIAAVLAEREVQERPPPELVWTGPEGVQATARDTAIVLSQLFERAEARVVLAGYSFLNAEKVLKPLHLVMAKREVQTIMLVDVTQPSPGQPQGEAWAQQVLADFLERNWPFGAPYPELHCDRRALLPGPPWYSLHAKCVSIDGSKAFLSSANFTARGQERNLEAGVLIHDVPFAEQLERQWMSLIASGLTCRYRRPEGESGSKPSAPPTLTASAFDVLRPYTREPRALTRLEESGLTAPDETGVDIMVDDESVARAEWRWLERRIALLVPDSSPAAVRRLQASGWRTVSSTDERDMDLLIGWLREGAS